MKGRPCRSKRVRSLVYRTKAAPPADSPDQTHTDLLFVPVKPDAPVHDPAKHTYWFGLFAECSSVLDIDGVGKLDVAAYLDEFTFRFNRRKSKSRSKLFFRLMQQAVTTPPATYDILVKRSKPGAQPVGVS